MNDIVYLKIKENEDKIEHDNENIIIGENVTILNNNQNNETIKEPKIENKENDKDEKNINIISAQLISADNKEPDKDEEDLNKRLRSRTYMDDKKLSIEEKLRRMKAIVKAQKLTKKPFRIRRAIFVKKEK